MRYSFVIDHNRCIGCHACTVACKEEHNVPVGVFRTWVKYIEKGSFPDTTRHFGVLRCNHCDNAPCVEICPTTALFRRPDGIVDFDSARCIGCKSCMQACPYDALYIDPNTNTAAKCNFCAHRVEMNLEPACVIVCPTQAIIAGDLDEPKSKVNRIVATQRVAVRKPQKGTEPKLFYVGIDGDLLHPSALEQQKFHFWSEKQPGEDRYEFPSARAGAPGPAAAREVYDVAHPAPWGWKISAYLWTKSIATGILVIASFLIALNYNSLDPILAVVAPATAVVFTGLTVMLLIVDLKRPLRFFFLITKPNLRSWVVIGAYIIGVYGILAILWLLNGWSGKVTPPGLVFATAPAAVVCACYSAFLFAQAKGRDLWQSPLFFWHLLLQSIIAGAASMRIIAAVANVSGVFVPTLDKVLALSLAVALTMIMIEVTTPPVGEDVKRAAELLTRGALAPWFWAGVVVLGTLVPIVIFCVSVDTYLLGPARVAGSALALAGLFIFEDLWVRAGQAVPLS